MNKLAIRCASFLLMITLPVASTASQNPECSGTVTEGVFSGSIACTPNDCSDECEENDQGVKPNGTHYSWCQCGNEPESPCCHVILLHVFGPDTPGRGGECGIPGCWPGECELRHTGLFSVDTVAGCFIQSTPGEQ